MSNGNSLLCRRLEAELLKRERIKGGTRHEGWIWFEQKTGPEGSLPAPATSPHTQPHSWDVHPPGTNCHKLSQIVTTPSAAPDERDQPKSLSTWQLLLGLLQRLIFWLIPVMIARPQGLTHPTFVWEPVEGAGSLIRV